MVLRSGSVMLVERKYYRIEPVDAPGEPALDANRA